MNDLFAGAWVLGAVSAVHVHSNRSRKTKIKAAGGFVLAPDFAAEFLNYFLKLKRIPVN